VRRQTRAESAARTARGFPAARGGVPRAYGMMVIFPLLVVIAAVVDWSTFRCA
jgi:hypothetical protein